MVENRPERLPCLLSPSANCPEGCRLHNFHKTKRSAPSTFPDTVSDFLSDILNEREEVFTKLCEQRKNQAPHESVIQTLKAALQEHLHRA